MEKIKHCIVEPPPTLSPIPRPTQCVEGKLCMDVADMNTWAENTERLLDRIADNWVDCGMATPTSQPASP